MDLISFIKQFPIKEFSKDETLLLGGSSSTSVYALREGFVKISAVQDDGKQRVLFIAGRYDIVPLENLFSPKPVRYEYTALASGSAYEINKQELLEKASTSPDAMTELARGLSEHYDDLMARVHAVDQSDVRMKLLYILHNICTKFSSSESPALHELGLNLTHQDLADMVGATRETVSVEMKKLMDEGVVQYSRSTFQVYMKQLNDIVEVPA